MIYMILINNNNNNVNIFNRNVYIINQCHARGLSSFIALLISFVS